jgi:AcrR family transcriptional regulator
VRADARRNRERILVAAQSVFAEKGPSASTEDVAATAGVAIGTVFRHFPTKQALLQAITKDRLLRLTHEASTLAVDGDASTALFAFFSRTVEQAAQRRTVVDPLAESGVEVEVTEAVQALRHEVGELLARSRLAGAVRDDVGVDEVLALLTTTCHGALRAGWDPDLRRRTVAIIFDGLRPTARRLPDRRQWGPT